MKRIVLTLILLGFSYSCLLSISSAKAAGTGQYFKGNGGYGRITNASFHDLDYTKDFSVEAVIDVAAYLRINEYESILSKTQEYGIDNGASGWALGVFQEIAGARIYAKVGDGTNNIKIGTSLWYLDRIHLAMVWNAGMKSLTLYVNGTQAAQGSNGAMVLANIKNTYDFWLGNGPYRFSGSIIYSRLWNRDISADIGGLYTHYSSVKQHELPEGFDTIGLVSEWLMFEESDALGDPGTTHVKDTIGSNHIQMLDSAGKTTGKDIADIVFSEGNLELVSPANGAINQHKSVYLTVKGGYQTLSAYGTVKGPVQYYFQIDETAGFDSPGLKESGWIDYLNWQPILNPNTAYYWRVKVKDSNSVPLESNYTSAYFFTTETPCIWYARPAGGSYGTEDGTSYDNAWDGLDSIKWGENGVEAGDTLYICGTHIRTVTTNYYIMSQGKLIPKSSGTANSRILISGVYPGDPGIIWGAYKDERPDGMKSSNWQEISPGVFYNETSTYYMAFTDCGLFEDITDLDYKEYKNLSSSADVLASSEEGVYYLEKFGTNQHRVWLRPFNVATFKQNIRWSGAGNWSFVLSQNNSYIQIKDITFMALGINHDYQSASAKPYHDYTFEVCKFFAFHSGYLYTPWNSYNITIDNCEFAYSGNCIYMIWNHGPIHHITIKNSYFHDIGRPFGGSWVDGQGISIQNKEYIYILNNKFERCGSAVCSDLGPDPKTCRHIYIKNNFIREMCNNWGIDDGSGIVITSHSTAKKGNSEDLVIENNIITNCDGAGIASNRKDYVEIYNNSVNSCNANYKLIQAVLEGASAKAYNNISLNPKPYFDKHNPAHLKDYPLHFYFRQLGDGYSTAYDFEGDYNLYYPNAGQDEAFHFYVRGAASVGTNFTEWKKGHLSYGDVVDTCSLLSNPLCKNGSGNYSEPEDFQSLWNSPVIDSGIKINGRDSDYYGNPIYGLSDIGAIEYQPPYLMGKDKPDKTGNVRVYGDGKFRNKGESSGVIIDLAVMPIGSNTSEWIDISVESWDTGLKKWEEESLTMASNSVQHIVGDLKANTNYLVKVNSVPGQGIAGCADGIINSGSQGKVGFDYIGGYSQELIFEIEETGGEPPVIEGDVDGDGDVDILDLQLCVNYVLSGEYNEAADLDNNGKVNLIDVQIIVNKIIVSI